MTQIIYDDFLYNADMGFDRGVTCRGNGDFQLSPQGDIQYTASAAQAVLQKIFLWMSIAPGEVSGQPDLGCCIKKYFHKKATPSNFALLEREIKYQLDKYIPEIRCQSVSVTGEGNEYGRIDGIRVEILSQDFGKFDLSTSENNIDDLHESLTSMSDAISFIQENNQ